MIAALIFLTLWLALALVVGVIIGMTIREADVREQPEAAEAADHGIAA